MSRAREACSLCQADVTHVVRLADREARIVGAMRACGKHARRRAMEARAAGRKVKVSQINVPGNRP